METFKEILNYINPIISAVSAGAAGISAFVAYKALQKTEKIIADTSDARKVSEDISMIMMVLEIESQMNERKSAWDKASLNIRESEAAGTSSEIMEIICDYHETTKENYFNSLERLCFCISKQYLKEKDWKVEYRNLLKDTIRDNAGDFGVSTPYTNIVDLNSKWQREP